MPYTNVVGRGDTAALVPEEVSNSMLGHIATQESAALQMFKRIAVTSSQTRFPILSALAQAYWVAGDTGLKQTGEEQWSNKFLNIEELAVVVPIPENVLADVEDEGGINLWEEVQPDIEIAFGRALDAAVFFGINAPGSFPPSVAAAAEAGGFVHTENAAQSAGGIQDDLDQAMELIEAPGFDPNGMVAARTLRGKLRRARSTIGERLPGVDPAITEYNGMPIAYPMRGLFPVGANRVEAFVGDFSEYIIGVRQDISFKLLDQAVLQNTTGEITVNLAQQDMVAMRFTMRLGWQVSNRIRYDQPNEANRYPVAVVKSPT